MLLALILIRFFVNYSPQGGGLLTQQMHMYAQGLFLLYVFINNELIKTESMPNEINLEIPLWVEINWNMSGAMRAKIEWKFES